MRASLPGRLAAVMARAGNTVGDEFFPVLVWLTVFGVTRLAPSLILRLSIAVPQSMDFPSLLQWRRTSSSSGLTADELSTQLADMINSTPSGSSSRSRSDDGGVGADLLPAAWARSHVLHRISEILFSLCTYPQRLLTYIVFQRIQRPALLASDVAQRSRPVAVKLLLRLVTSFTSIWVHAGGNMLYDTLVTYISTRMGSWGSGGTAGFVLGNSRPGQGSSRLSGGWRDLLVASCISTGLNVLLQTFWLEAMTSVGGLRSLGQRPASPVARDETAQSFTHVVLSTLSRLGRKDTLYRLGRMVLHPQPTLPPPPPPPPSSQSVPASPPGPASTAPAQRPCRPPPPARVFLCGGNTFVFALSGFRFALYSDIQQLTTSTANLVTDALDIFLRQANQRAAAQRYRSSSDAMMVGESHTWRPPARLQEAHLATSSDVVLSPAASMQLLPMYMVNFAVGAGVGLLWRERLLLMSVGRKVPLVRNALEVLSPLPPPPLKLPEALQELSPECNILVIHASGTVEVIGEDRVPPIVKRGEAAAATSPSAQRQSEDEAANHCSDPVLSSASVRLRLVVAHRLFCPIKRTLMCDPVQTVDGFTYDRDGIEEWLRVHDTAPLTNLQLNSVAVRVNWAARQQIEALISHYTAAKEMH
ncbi:hypothetical protein ABL78_6435 [Leptomonas seymouri]|uniref:U-box domain-containing protein n=1 Tax=Leptomonas seymouri TaxID=5684 RepID=A0A0N1IIV8_LEPSE|nr:hypothetical protein ABL78_6435 [Leptomonas seymouri]|eukprot:KPI84500.1 hypothetical protein ABL78_6435 [Leptomonas seymouri]